jgi:dihydrodipicolinate synthase/N-acetylneuraminate lyase
MLGNKTTGFNVTTLRQAIRAGEQQAILTADQKNTLLASLVGARGWVFATASSLSEFIRTPYSQKALDWMRHWHGHEDTDVRDCPFCAALYD